MKSFRYGIIGRGKWGARIHQVLKECPRPVHVWDISRRGKEESKESYSLKVQKALREHKGDVDIVWLAVPPGDQDIFLEHIFGIGKHAIVEKPWICDPSSTEALIRKSEQLGLQVGIDYQYCFLEKARKASQMVSPNDRSVRFSGEFSVSQKDRLNIPAIHNLGSHLLAVRNLLFPNAKIDRIITRYEHAECRKITVAAASGTVEIDFLRNTEPLVQRLIDQFEKCILEKKEFPLNLRFASNLNKLIDEEGLGP